MDSSDFPYFAVLPLLVFGPLFLWILYNFGLKEIFKTPGEIRERRRLEREEAARDSARVLGKRARPEPVRRRAVRLPPLAWVGQGLAYAAFAAFIGYFSAAPAYTTLGPGQALVKLSLTHAGKRKVECRRRTREELAKLPPNMRAPQACPRERWPVLVELEVDGKPIYRKSVAPAGLSGDGPSSFYATFPVPAGTHHVALRVRDRGATRGFDYVREADVTLAPAQALVVGFRANDPAVFLK